MNDLTVLNNPQIPSGRISEVAEVVLSSLRSKTTRACYGKRLSEYLMGDYLVSRGDLLRWINDQRSKGRSGSAINQTIAAVKKMGEEAFLRGYLGQVEWSGLESVSYERAGLESRQKTGVWLSLDQVKKLLDAPDKTKWHGLRDRALMSMLIGCGLRRSEIVSLNWGSYKYSHGRMVVEVRGKGEKLRVVPVAQWVVEAVERYRLAGSEDRAVKEWLEDWGPMWLAKNNESGGEVSRLSAEMVFYVVERWGKTIGLGKLAPHDLRRTMAQLMRRAGVELEQIQLTLGHSSIQTTEVYLGSKLECGLGVAGVDRMGLEVSV